MRRGPVTWYSYLLLGFFTFALTIQGNVLPFIKAGLGLSYGTASLHSSAVAAGMVLVGLLGDRFVRRTGRRFGLRLGTAAVIAGLLLMASAPSVWVSLAGCLLIGALGALIPATVFAVLSDVQGEHRATAYNESNAVSYAFAITAPLSMSLCLSLSLSWWFALVFGAAVGLVIAVAYRRIVVPPPAGPMATGSGRLPPAYWAYWCCLGMSVSIEFSVLIWAPTFLEKSVGLPPATAAGATAAFSLAMLVGRTAGGRLVRAVSIPRLFIGELFLASIGFALYWGAADPRLAIVGLFLIGLGVALLYPAGAGSRRQRGRRAQRRRERAHDDRRRARHPDHARSARRSRRRDRAASCLAVLPALIGAASSALRSASSCRRRLGFALVRRPREIPPQVPAASQANV